jgi:NADPH:quinone reductase-like Zn-dependent oxidoreductase
MKAVVYSKYGPPEVLRLAQVDKPVPRDNEVLIRVRAAEATKGDCELRSFRFPVKWFWLPLRIVFGITRPRRKILGAYFAGEVVAVGSQVKRFAIGDPVYGASGFRFGCYGEYLALPESASIAAKPQGMSFEEAAAVPLGGLNALHFMRGAAIQEGESVLIHGAGGSIGTHAIQIAKSMGAVVTAVDKASKEAGLRRLGADQFIDYNKQRFEDKLASYDVVFNMVPSASYSACLRTLKPGGRLLSGNPSFSTMLRAPLTTWFTDKKVKFAFAKESTAELEDLRSMIEDGSVQSIVDTVYEMEQASEAHRRVEAEDRVGAIVLSMSDRSDRTP